MSDTPTHPEGHPWQWGEPTWRRIVGRARAGRSLSPATWPGSARCAVAVSFNCDHETRPLRDADESPTRLSQGEYGARRAMPRIRALLQREAVAATFFYPAVSAKLHTDEVRGVVADGHEVGFQSWISELPGDLPFEVERDLTFRAYDFISGLIGKPPAGYRAAGGDFSPNTMSIIRMLELQYDSSLMGDDDPYELLEDGDPTGMVELPPEWIRDDSAYFDAPYAHAAASMAAEAFRAEFEGAWAERGLFLLTLHPRLIGHRSRIFLLETLLQRMKATGDVWFATLEQVATWCEQNT